MNKRKRHDTATRVLFVRAWEYHQPREVRVCSDPIAERLLSPVYRLFATSGLCRKFFWKRMNAFQKSLFGYIPLRTRLIDDCLHEHLSHGMAQLVILGAGYDTRAYRFEALKDNKRVFEVDLPGNLAQKISRMEKALGSLPDHVTYAPIDFENEDLFEKLGSYGYREGLNTLFIWEGVTFYLEPETVSQTLASIADQSKPGSSVIFDYVSSDVVSGACRMPFAQRMVQAAEQLGEPIKFGIEPESVEDYLSERGFTQVKNHSVEECKLTYKDLHKDREVPGFFNIVHATVA